MISALFGLLLGVAVGARHAFEPDHLTAMATLVADTRDAGRGALLGALWGLGHTISLVAVAVTLIAIGEALPVRLAAGFELAVSGVLVVLGARAVVLGLRGEVIVTQTAHTHDGALPHVHVGRRTFALRPVLVGLVHGLAGSGALTAVAIARSPSNAGRLAYVALFGVGSVGGMALVSGFAAASLGRLRAPRAFGIAVGALSIAVGIAWSVPLWQLV